MTGSKLSLVTLKLTIRAQGAKKYRHLRWILEFYQNAFYEVSKTHLGTSELSYLTLTSQTDIKS